MYQQFVDNGGVAAALDQRGCSKPCVMPLFVLVYSSRNATSRPWIREIPLPFALVADSSVLRFLLLRDGFVRFSFSSSNFVVGGCLRSL